MDIMIPLNVKDTRHMLVEKEHTAKILGSGEVEVLATPMLIALMEAAAMYAVQPYLPSGWTTVGTKVNIEHMRAIPLGERISAEATLIKREGRALEFAVEARDNFGMVGQGTHKRIMISLERFLDKLKKSG